MYSMEPKGVVQNATETVTQPQPQLEIQQPKTNLAIRVCLIVGLCASVFALLMGAVALYAFPGYISTRVTTMLELRSGTPRYEKWINPPVPRKLSVYLFNITNPIQVLNGALADFREIGPYVFINKKRKVIIFENETHVRYQDMNDISFVETETHGSFNDTVTIFNLPLMTVVKNLLKQKLIDSEMAQYGISMLDSLLEKQKETALITTSVGNLLIDGVQAQWLNKLIGIAKSLGKDPKNPLKNGTFAFLRDLREHTYTILKKITPNNSFAKIVAWNNFTDSTTLWNSTTCNQINGTDGAQFNPHVSKSDTLYIFSSEMCRSVPLTFEKEVEHEGISLLRFVVDSAFTANATINPENGCICNSPDNCPPGGITPVDRCTEGKAIYISAPHFYTGDLDVLLRQFNGVNPVKEAHETYLDVHPLTGLTLRVRKRLQINADVNQCDDIQAMQKLTTGIYPVMWMEEAAELSSQNAVEFKNRVEKPQKTANSVTTGLLSAGSSFTVLFGALLLFNIFGLKNRLTAFIGIR